MKILGLIARCLLASLMVFAGVMHFAKPDFFLKIMPPYIPLHLELVYLSGLCEISLGILLLTPRFSQTAGWGIVALLIAVFPANIYLYQHQDIVPATPTIHFLRLVLQGFLVLWAYAYTKPANSSTSTSQKAHSDALN
jgi:uncharacterized membrane protein